MAKTKTTREYVEDTLALLENICEPYEFTAWSSCACGKLYQAVTGHVGYPPESTDRTFRAVAEEVARYLPNAERLAVAVEPHTARNDHGTSNKALFMISEAASQHAFFRGGIRGREGAIALFQDVLKNMPTGMDIGTPQRVITVEPAVIPVPQREETERRRPSRREPVPNPDPVREPERVETP